jgi:hypothetical protein
MKKTIILSAVVVMALAAASCKKSRTCTCNSTYDRTVTTTSSSGGTSVTVTDPQTSTTEIAVVEDKISKKDGRRKYGCVDHNSDERQSERNIPKRNTWPQGKSFWEFR